MPYNAPISGFTHLFQTRQDDCQVGAGTFLLGRQHRAPGR